MPSAPGPAAGAPGPRPRTPAGRARVAARVLAATYPGTCALVHADAFQLLVATVLSAQTTDERVNQVTPALFARYGGAAALAGADPQALEAIIRPTGFFRTKARALIRLAGQLVDEHGGTVPGAMAQLTRLPGVGRKTANVVLGVGFGVPGLAVDTHVTRLANLLGLVATRDPVKIEQQVTAMLPPSQWTGFGLRLIEHGRQVCVANRPRCPVCPLQSWCPSSSTRAGPTAGRRARRGAPPGGRRA